MKSFCEEYSVRFVDNSQFPCFLEHPELLNDTVHLNDDGAKLYAQMFLEEKCEASKMGRLYVYCEREK